MPEKFSVESKRATNDLEFDIVWEAAREIARETDRRITEAWWCDEADQVLD